jgi:hypothetical protein
MELQDKRFSINLPQDKGVDGFLSISSLYQSLENDEKDLFYWVNVLRSNPSGFGKTLVQPFLLQFPEANSSYSKSLLKDLENCNSLPMVEPGAALMKASKSHASDLSLHQNGISHTSSDGRNFQMRMSEAGIVNCAGENIYEGKKDALLAVLLLLIDQGVPNKGHRLTLLNPQFTQMGLAYAPRKNSPYFFLVQIFSCK